MRIEDHLRQSAGRFGPKTALIAGGTQLSYGELDRLSDYLAASLVANGIKAGDRVLMIAENSVEAIVAFFAAWKAGAVPCPLYASIKQDKLRAIIDSTEPSTIFAQARFLNVVDSALSGADHIPLKIAFGTLPTSATEDWLVYEAIATHDGEAELPRQVDSEALALLIHTSGSTGTPKGVMHSHASLLAACGSIIEYLENRSDDIMLSVLPISFGYGITQILTMVMVGGTLVLEKSFAFPRKVLQRLAEVKATGFPLVPPMAALITGMQDLQPGFLPDLRYITSAAAAMPPSVSQRLRTLLPDARLFLMYGQTECIRATYLAADEADRQPLSVGRAIPGTRAFVIDEDGRLLGSGEIGELVVEGPHVMSGYWGDALASSAKLLPITGGRRLHTGDLFKTDEDGFLYFVSRRDDIIKTRGEKVSPQEVERVLYALSGIREAAVAGIDDPVFGQLIRAYVALEADAGLSEKDILRHCATHLEDYMVPKSVEFRDALPKTSTGKIRLSAEQSTPDIEDNVA
ncbi:AMP-dependent synthetase and ligase [Rhizobium wenxiniae]|uniref:Amino acid adenylation domain-containing protein n=1 Tax=Rhizobium wenxiniae TaxID=1737357 RepID=A0A7X0CZZ0_9HYPH|nr:class I adenylate-forming enzyme family protein [Rhizobium wenxiniae]MBB6162895.1 amino acid adenylation domain-containing protein [Rhizobium wenxiniae]GGF95030.1 AMP-dependent synthetase and ligase [Rhizobium wenxiniae]